MARSSRWVVSFISHEEIKGLRSECGLEQYLDFLYKKEMEFTLVSLLLLFATSG